MGSVRWPPKSRRRRPYSCPPPLLGRGAGAWDAAAQAGDIDGLAEGAPNWLHVHAVSDSQNRQYARAVRGWLEWAERRWGNRASLMPPDAALADYLAFLSYVRRKHVSAGESTLSGVVHIFPALRAHLPLARRAMVGWRRLGQAREGIGFGVEIWGLIMLELCARETRRPRRRGLQAALLVAVAVDTYLRHGQERFGLRVSDVVAATIAGAESVSLLLGSRDRGERAKTGFDQGVVVSRPWVAALLLRWRAQRRAQVGEAGLLWSISAGEFAELWHDVIDSLQLPDLHPQHCTRHAGATIDLQIRRIPRETVRVRGRWISDRSVQRYTKAHPIVRLNARLTPEQLARGLAFFSNPLAAWLGSLEP